MALLQCTSPGCGRILSRPSGPKKSVQLFLVIGVLGFSQLKVFAQEHSSSSQRVQTVTASCLPKDGGISCDCAPPAGAGGDSFQAESFRIPLSEDSPKLLLRCSGDDNTVAPENMKDGMVCPATTALPGCTARGVSGAPQKLEDLLAPGDAKVVWTEDQQEGSKYSLTIPQDRYPFVDQDFLVGCKTAKAVVCNVMVAVKARTSRTSGRTAKCSYGIGSNSYNLSVMLTPSNNQFTLSCEGGGAFVPSTISTNYCLYGEYVEQKTSCLPNLTYSDLIPGFSESWWTTTGNHATLKIPEDKFPDTDKTFTVGCKPPSNTSEGAHEGTYCSVDVTVSGAGTTSPGSPEESASPEGNSSPVKGVVSGVLMGGFFLSFYIADFF
ncbi:sag-related sequence srs30d [Cystoisospora suis]|uniref:Sag-related sequence srs30d n=1 Tax=Cystoisospora suis TaxID=483139 RepID=A0A2C6KKW2_9APIC|nr:sag-related sequence srs30d [Cystoisospora suis]